MPIYIPPVMSPLVWTEDSWDAYTELHIAEMDYINAYRDAIGLFAMFSRKKHKRLTDCQKNYRLLRGAYYKTIASPKNQKKPRKAIVGLAEKTTSVVTDIIPDQPTKEVL